MTNAGRFKSTALAAARTIVASYTGGAVDIKTFSGKGKIVLNAGGATAGTLPTMAVKITQCATSGGTYVDAPGLAFTQVTTAASAQSIGIDWDDLDRFVKVEATLGGTDTPTFAFSVTAEHLIKQTCSPPDPCLRRLPVGGRP